MSVGFRRELEKRIVSISKTQVGLGTDPANYVKTFDVFLHDLEIDSYPFLVVTVTQVEQVQPGEMGTLRELENYSVIIYYLDITTKGETYIQGEERRDTVAHKLQIALEKDPRLGNLRVDLEKDTGLSEYVYDSDFSTLIFDSSGQEEFYTFVTELHLTVRTAKN